MATVVNFLAKTTDRNVLVLARMLLLKKEHKTERDWSSRAGRLFWVTCEDQVVDILLATV